MVWYRTGVSLLFCVAMANGCAPPPEDSPDAVDSQAWRMERSTCQPVTPGKDIAPGSVSSFPDFDAQPPTRLGRTVFFAANDGQSGLELWKSDGAEAGTALVKDIHSGAVGADPRLMTAVGNTLFFIANDGATGRELWKTDGTAGGTVLVKDIRSGPESSGASSLLALGDTLFFVADDGIHGPELWKSDGTEAGTVLVEDITPGSQGSGLGSLAVFKGVLYFAADGGPHEAELWKSDGTEAGTEPVAVVRVIESDPGEQLIRGLSPVGEALYFFAGSAYGEQWDLWKSDGSSAGTVRVRVLTQGPADYKAGPVSLVPASKQVFFRAGEGGSLWRSDGTSGGTFIVKNTSDARWLTVLGETLLFTAWDDASGFELWKSDGTVAGTVPVKDIRPGKESSAPFWLTVVDGQVQFSAETAEHGRELWTTDGTQDGTKLLHDIAPGTASSEPAWLLPVGPRVFFLANHDTSGFEPWVLNDCIPPELSCPADLVADAAGPGGALVSYPSATARDNKSEPPSLGYSHSNGGNFPLGKTPVIVTATDESGNSSRCTFSVNVRDAQPPALTCPPDLVVARMSREGALVDYPPAIAIDEISRARVSYSHAAGSTFPVGQTLVTVTATDESGNASHCTFGVKVRRTYEQRGCGCGASPGGASGGMLLMALALFLGRRKKARPDAR